MQFNVRNKNTESLLRRLLFPASAALFSPPPSLSSLLTFTPFIHPREHNGPILSRTRNRRLCPYSYSLCSQPCPLKSTVLNPQILQRTVSLRLPLLVYLMRLRAGTYAHV